MSPPFTLPFLLSLTKDKIVCYIGLLELVLLVLPYQEQVPYKSGEEFELITKYEFKQRVEENKEAIDFKNIPKRTIGPLPYLELALKVLKKQPGEDRIRVTTNLGQTVLNKKVAEGMVVKLDLGFTADIKDRITAHEYAIMFNSSDKRQPVSKIIILVEKDGTFLVNGENRGRL